MRAEGRWRGEADTGRARSKAILIVLLWQVAAISLIGTPAIAAEVLPEDLSYMSIEDLANIEITSVAKRPEALSNSPAAVYVITRDDILRSGALSLPEALRLAPNLTVAQVDARSYAMAARGFNASQGSNKLLVLVDGRSVYTPLNATVYWDGVNVLMSDVERIEVISGPGGTLWGANAVNGVINIITRSSGDSQGGLVEVSGGDRQRNASLRFGGALGDSATYRIYASGFDRDAVRKPTGASAGDGWQGGQLGFRVDADAGKDAYTVQGDTYRASVDNDPKGKLWGGNLLARWTRRLDNGSGLELQAYFDDAERSLLTLRDSVQTFEVRGQHGLSLGERHQVVWGAGYRLTRESLVNSTRILFLVPPRRDVGLGDIFVQDEIALRPDLTLTLGIKIEDSSYSGTEYLPSARLAWRRTDSTMLWGAISRAVRTPSRVDRDLVAPGILVAGNFQSEGLIAYEAGYRGQPSDRTSLSVSLFYNRYSDLRSSEFVSGGHLPFVLANGVEGSTYGLEAWGTYDPNDDWRLSAGVSALHKDLRLKPGHTNISVSSFGLDPDYQAQLRAQGRLSPAMDLDVRLRAVDSLSNDPTPAYVEADARLAWRLTNSVELSLDGRNLLDASHREIAGGATVREVRRSVSAGLRWRFWP